MRKGTDISWTYWDEYYDGTRYGFSSTPRNGHLFGHPVPPIIAKEDAAGVVAGTTSHFSGRFLRSKSSWKADRLSKLAAARPTAMLGAILLEESQRHAVSLFPATRIILSLGSRHRHQSQRSCDRATSNSILPAVLSGSAAAPA